MKNILFVFKIPAFVLVAVCFTLAVSQSLSAGVPGDVNNDGKRGLEDVILILQEISNIRELIDEDNDGYAVPVDCNDANPDIHPGSFESCDGLDNDCDGMTDEDLATPLCENQTGVCAGSQKQCAGSEGWQPCTSETYEMYTPLYQASETECDGIDNDCDGQTDEQCFP
jgi:hypothetical protein